MRRFVSLVRVVLQSERQSGNGRQHHRLRGLDLYGWRDGFSSRIQRRHFPAARFDPQADRLPPGELRFATRVAGREPIRLWVEPGRWEMTALDTTGKTIAPPITVEASQLMMLTPIVGQTLTLKHKPNQ